MSNIPTFIKQRAVGKDGEFTPQVQLMFDQLFQQLQNNSSNRGLVAPSQPTTTITNLATPPSGPSMPNGTIWYDSTTNEMKAKINGVVKVFTLT